MCVPGDITFMNSFFIVEQKSIYEKYFLQKLNDSDSQLKIIYFAVELFSYITDILSIDKRSKGDSNEEGNGSFAHYFDGACGFCRLLQKFGPYRDI